MIPNPEQQNSSTDQVETIRRFFEDNKKFFDFYAEDASLTIKNGDDVGLDTFAIDLERGEMFYSSKYFVEHGYEPSFAMKSTLHEAEHFKELMELFKKENGRGVWQRHLRKLKKDEAIKIMDNCFDDVKMDASVVSNAPVLNDVPKRLVLEKQFPEKDLKDLPKHLQFAYALKAEGISGEIYELADDVRSEIEALQNFGDEAEKVDLLQMFSRPSTPMADRIAFQEKFLEPILERLKEDDDKNFEDKNKAAGGDQGGDENQGEPKEGDAGEKDKYAKLYKQFWQNNPSPIELDPTQNPNLEKQIENFAKRIEEENKDQMQRAERSAASQKGVDLADLKKYEDFKATLDEKAKEELLEQIKRIVKERTRQKQMPKYPVDEGDRLVDPSGAYIAVKAGNLKPAIWEREESQEKKEKKVSNFDLHIVADLSTSMDGEKLREQRKADALLLEAMKELFDELESEESEGNIEEHLSVRTECLTFGSGVVEIKKLDSGLTEKERVLMYKTLGEASGSTKDFLALQKIDDELDQKTADEIKRGDRLKLVIVTTDGQSDNPELLKQKIKSLRDKGAIVVGVGITEDGRVAISNYDPDGELALTASELPTVFKNILNKHLEKL